jgi:hypothetical protein
LWDVEDKQIIWSRDVQFDELAQDLCDAEAVQLFRDKINKIHQTGDQPSGQISDEYSDQYSNHSPSPSPSQSCSQSRSQSPFPSPFKLPESKEEPDELLNFFRANISDQITFSSFGRRLMPSRRLQEAKAGVWHTKINPHNPQTYQEAV